MSATDNSPRYVVTGPSGWVGQAMLAHLARALGGPLGGCVAAFASVARTVALPGGEALAVRALADLQPDDVEGAHVIHLAFLTKEKVATLGARAFFDANRAIDDIVLRAIGNARPRSLFVASSGAAALAEAGSDHHPYGVAKLHQERRFCDAATARGLPLIAGRIYNLSGPHINKLDAYALSNFIQQARAHGRIAIEATVPVFRSFLHVDDLCGLICAAGHGGVGGNRPLSLCGAEIVEMADLATAVAACFDQPIAIERGPVDWDRPSRYVGDFTQTRSLARQLGLPLRPLSRQVAETVAWMGGMLHDQG